MKFAEFQAATRVQNLAKLDICGRLIFSYISTFGNYHQNCSSKFKSGNKIKKDSTGTSDDLLDNP